MAPRVLNIPQSENVASASFDPDLQELAVTFLSGPTYIYSGFTEENADEFERAESAGKHIFNVIKNLHPARRVS